MSGKNVSNYTTLNIKISSKPDLINIIGYHQKYRSGYKTAQNPKTLKQKKYYFNHL